MNHTFRFVFPNRTRLRAAGIPLLVVAGLLAAPLRALASVHEHHSERGADHSVPRTGQWAFNTGDSPKLASISFSASGHGWMMNWSSSGIPIATLEGLDASKKSAGSSPVDFRLKRDAGTFACNGVIEDGFGAGVFKLALDPTYAAELERRGVGRPSADQQARLAYADAGFGLLDELKRQKLGTPNLENFIIMATHGVNLEYVRGMTMLGYRLGSIPELIQARDHGVDMEYVGVMRSAGYRNLSFEQLLRARDHGVDSDFIEEFHDLGYAGLPLETLVRLRDHGVTGTYVEEMRDAGYRSQSLDQYQNARDHGVGPEYVASMTRAGFGRLPLGDLIRARDHGVDAAFVRRVQERERERPSLDEVIRLKDQGY